MVCGVKTIDRLFEHAQHYLIKHKRPHIILFILGHKRCAMRHHNIVQRVNVGPPDFSPVVLAQVSYPLEDNEPRLLELVRL